MIEVNLLVPAGDTHDIYCMESEDFEVLGKATVIGNVPKKYYFHINTTSEKILFLILKYGEKNVWIR